MMLPTSRRGLCGIVIGGALLALLNTAPAVADVVVGKVFPMTQPDGSTIQVRIWGDEFYTIVESLDGYTLVRDPRTRAICYARLSTDSRSLRSTGVPVGTQAPDALDLTPHVRIAPEAAAEQARAARADFEKRFFVGPNAPAEPRGTRSPTTGDVVGITLLVDFSDDEWTIPPGNVADYCNQIGYNGYGNNGSVRDYFYDVSDDQLNYTNFVPTAYYRALHPKSYYNDPNVSFGTRARELMLEALNALNASGFDFSQYDADGDNTVDALNMFYAGYPDTAWAEGLWPHAWSVSFCADGVCTYRYQMTNMGSSLSLSTFVHENGHMLMGWPDLYDYDYDSTGVGRFCIMCYGTSSTNPCHPCAYMKYDAGWITPTLLTTPTAGLIAPADGVTSYKYERPFHANEYYMIENRQKSGRDSGIPDSGLAIWHIDTHGSNNWNQQDPVYHYEVTLVQADGDWDMENNVNYGDSTDLWAAPSYRNCTPLSTPNTDWWDGSDSGLWVVNVSNSGATMTFDYNVGIDCNNNGIDDEDDIANCTGDPWCTDCNGNGVPDECDLSAGTSQDCNSNEIPDECEDCDNDGLADSCVYIWQYGVVGAYYANPNLSGTPIGRLDNRINFQWGTDAPMTGIGPDNFSVRWDGYLTSLSTAGTYTIKVSTDDGARFWLDGQLLVDEWYNQPTTVHTAYIDLEADTTYRMVLEYYDSTGDSTIRLWWQPPGGSLAAIPTANFTPVQDCNNNGVWDSCDIDDATSLDDNGNGIPDECESAPEPCRGDANCDGQIDFGDINGFVAALVDTIYCDGTGDNADVNASGDVDFADINPFVALLTENPLPITCP